MEISGVAQGVHATRSSRADMKRALAVVASVATAVAGGFAVSHLNASRDALVLAAIGALLLMPIAIRLFQRRFDPFEPIVVFAAAFGAMFLVRPVAMLVGDNFLYERWSLTIAVRDTFFEMMLLAAAAAAAFVAAYALPLGRTIATAARPPSMSFHSGRVVGGALATAAAGIALTTLFLVGAGEGLELIRAGRSARLTDAYRSSSSYLAHGPYLLVPSALILFAVGRAYARKGLVILAGVITLILLYLSVPTGSRMLLLPFAGGALVYHYVSRNSRPGIVTLAALVLVSLFVSSLLVNTRLAGDGRSGGFRDTASSTVRHPERMLAPLTRDSDAEMAPALAAALKLVPEEIGFMRGGAILGDFFTRPIPRGLWSEKPLPPRETIISRVWPDEYLHGVANPEFSVLLYFYLDFAVLGVIVGMAAYGVIARTLYEYFRAHDDNLVVRLVFSFSVPFVAIALRDSPVDTFVRAVFIFLPVLLVFRFASNRSPRIVGAE
jgi:hypothetical protein